MVWIRVLPVAVFALLAWGRCLVETALLSTPPMFGYFVGFHQTLWMTAVALTVVLAAHLILGVAVDRLLWLLYGGVLMLIPVLYAWISRTPLDMQYLSGSVGEIVMHTCTFCLTYRPNRPLSIELIVIFISLVAVGRLYGRSWTRSLLLAVVVQIAGSLLAVEWFRVSEDGRGLFHVITRLGNHPMYAVVCLYAVTVLIGLLVLRSGAVADTGGLLWCSVGVLFMWVLAALGFAVSGWFSTPFDHIMGGFLPATTGGFLCLLAVRPVRRWGLVTLGALLLVQFLVLTPLLLRKEARLSPFSATPPAHIRQ